VTSNLVVLVWWIPWTAIRSFLNDWAQPLLVVLGFVTLFAAWWAWLERRRTINLQVARRARRVRRSLDEWLQHPALITASTQPSSNQTNQLANWIKHVIQGENEVQTLLEEMLDTAGGASRQIQRATHTAYTEFLRASDLAHRWGSAHAMPTTSHMQQADAAKTHLEGVRKAVLRIIPKELA